MKHRAASLRQQSYLYLYTAYLNTGKFSDYLLFLWLKSYQPLTPDSRKIMLLFWRTLNICFSFNARHLKIRMRCMLCTSVCLFVCLSVCLWHSFASSNLPNVWSVKLYECAWTTATYEGYFRNHSRVNIAIMLYLTHVSLRQRKTIRRLDSVAARGKWQRASTSLRP